jgi:hypothetical protein
MSQLDPTSTADRLIGLLEHQQELVEQLDGLAERQRALIETDEPDALLELLGRRQKIVDQLVAGQDTLTRLAEALQAGAGGDVGPGLRRRIGSLIDDIAARLSGITQRDDQDRASLQQGRDRAAEALSEFRTARQAHQAYVKARAISNRFADRRG